MPAVATKSSPTPFDRVPASIVVERIAQRRADAANRRVERLRALVAQAASVGLTPDEIAELDDLSVATGRKLDGIGVALGKLAGLAALKTSVDAAAGADERLAARQKALADYEAETERQEIQAGAGSATETERMEKCHAVVSRRAEGRNTLAQAARDARPAAKSLAMLRQKYVDLRAQVAEYL